MPLRYRQFSKIIDTTATNGVGEAAPFVVDAGEFTEAMLSVTNETDSSWSTGIVTVQVSLDRDIWWDAPSSVITDNTISADGLYAIDLTDFGYVRFVPSTAEATLNVRVVLGGKVEV